MNLVGVILALILSVKLSDGRTYMTAPMAACRNIEIELAIQFIEPRQPLPKTWQEILFVRRIFDNPESGNLDTMRWTNALAIVPGAPVVKPTEGIKRLRAGMRLFAISRERTQLSDPVTKEASTGRCAIFVDPDGTIITSNWVTEVEAQLILKQIPDFDPVVQPVAFDNLEQLEFEEKERDSKAVELFKKHDRKVQIQTDNNVFAHGDESKGGKSLWYLWLPLCIYILALIVSLVARVLSGKGES